MARSILDLAYPVKCPSCGKPLTDADGPHACRKCVSAIRPNPRPPESDPKQFSFSVAYSACMYDGPMKELIHAFKYRRKRILSKLFSTILSNFVAERAEISWDIDALTFVPMHPERRRDREFNQSELLARGLAEAFSMSASALLQKTMRTSSQNELTREDRLINLRGAFRMNPDAYPITGKRLLLIDDVMTTGATLDECSRVLAKAGAAEIRCLTLARGI